METIRTLTGWEIRPYQINDAIIHLKNLNLIPFKSKPYYSQISKIKDSTPPLSLGKLMSCSHFLFK